MQQPNNSNLFKQDASEVLKYSSPVRGRLIIWSVFLFFVALLLWAGQAEVDEVVRADGKVMKGPNYQPPDLSDLVCLK